MTFEAAPRLHRHEIDSFEHIPGRKGPPLGRTISASTNQRVPQTVTLSGSTNDINLVPSEFALSQNYPNPFSDRTSIKLCVACQTRVKLEVYDSEGKNMKTLLDEEKPAGTYEIELNATDFPAGGLPKSEVVYGYRMTAGDFTATKKMVFLKHSLK
jgi:hypothetical protein